ncbi:MAG: acetamidase/formamidase family protein [Lentisphaeria bacterium]|nr:acetamidase/formamidase family protein [Lentisphaeria bacterium]
MNPKYDLDSKYYHGFFAPSLAPIVELTPGEPIHFSVPDAGWGLENHSLNGYQRKELPCPTGLSPKGHCLFGPISIKGAKPDTTLEIKVLKLEMASWGWTQGGWPTPDTSIATGQIGPHLMTWELDGNYLVNNLGHRVKSEPFLGVMGLPMKSPEMQLTTPPQFCGGNIDCKHITEGSSLYLPVTVPGALFSAGDAHHAQGNGEICGNAIETMAEHVSLSFEVHLEKVDWPIFENDHLIGVLCAAPSLNHACNSAVQQAVLLLSKMYELPIKDARALGSALIDLEITQCVNQNLGVQAILSKEKLQTCFGELPSLFK